MASKFEKPGVPEEEQETSAELSPKPEEIAQKSKDIKERMSETLRSRAGAGALPSDLELLDESDAQAKLAKGYAEENLPGLKAQARAEMEEEINQGEGRGKPESPDEAGKPEDPQIEALRSSVDKLLGLNNYKPPYDRRYDRPDREHEEVQVLEALRIFGRAEAERIIMDPNTSPKDKMGQISTLGKEMRFGADNKEKVFRKTGYESQGGKQIIVDYREGRTGAPYYKDLEEATPAQKRMGEQRVRGAIAAFIGRQEYYHAVNLMAEVGKLADWVTILNLERIKAIHDHREEDVEGLDQDMQRKNYLWNPDKFSYVKLEGDNSNG